MASETSAGYGVDDSAAFFAGDSRVASVSFSAIKAGRGRRGFGRLRDGTEAVVDRRVTGAMMEIIVVFSSVVIILSVVSRIVVVVLSVVSSVVVVWSVVVVVSSVVFWSVVVVVISSVVVVVSGVVVDSVRSDNDRGETRIQWSGGCGRRRREESGCYS